MGYFNNKDELITHAKLWSEEAEIYFKDQIEESVKNSIIYESNIDTYMMNSGYNGYDTKIKVVNCTTTQAIHQYTEKKKVAALNFASYKHPGGMFLKGSNAQEECLCHDSVLYNILKRFEDTFYKPNYKRLNNALYNSNLIYTPNVLFNGDDVISYCDIITCAAPNRSAARRWKNISDDVILCHMDDRIDHVLYSAYDNKVEILILGAFGCGVFGNDTRVVAGLFNTFLNSKYKGCFDEVIFAIPGGKNYDIFKEEFSYER